MKLVERTAAEVRRRHCALYSLTVLVDLPAARQNRPTQIGGFVPDVFAIDAPETCRIIGEAKTPLDCETERSRKQIEAFLRHLALFPNGFFYLCVPLLYRVRAAILLSAMVQTVDAAAVTTDVIVDV